MLINLTQLSPGQTGIINQIQGGDGVTRRLHTIGLREGKQITKLSSHFWRGPQTVIIDNFHIAVGFGMAKKIIVEILE